MCALPLYHIFALTVNAMMGMSQGAHNVLIPNPRDIPAFVKEWASTSSTSFAGLNTLFNALLNNEDFRSSTSSHCCCRWAAAWRCSAGGRPLEATDRLRDLGGLRPVGDLAGGHGQPVRRRILRHDRPAAAIDRYRHPRRGRQVDLPLGEVGEICIRGPQVMAGYWNRPDETAKVMTEDGYFRSGDMGFMDESGYTKIVDRKKDMILVSGFNVYPNEIEEVAVSHPGVAEAAAIGVPDEHSGEAVKLFVVRKDPKLTEAASRSIAPRT
jgi:long-chain acyl-CoA synthetase